MFHFFDDPWLNLDEPYLKTASYLLARLTALLHPLVASVASAHVVLQKRDSRAAIGWVGLIWLSPFIGAIVYVIFGINRLRRRAQTLRGIPRTAREQALILHDALHSPSRRLFEVEHLQHLSQLVGNISQLPLVPANRITPLEGGDCAYPRMLQAIEGAQHTIGLCTYLFNRDDTGHRFAQALTAAVRRGVQVRVLIDDIGARYTMPSITHTLRHNGVPVARFLRSLIPGWSAYANLRNHRKLLIVDGTLGFTGGMNIREAHGRRKHESGMNDLHFQVEGPVVEHLQRVFVDDWQYTTEETLSGEGWFPPLAPCGDTWARGIPDGPDGNFDRLRLVLMGALSCARSSVRIVTPYFLPDAALIAALNTAALRGVQVDIVLPEKNNLIMVQWAATAQLWQVLQRGCRVWLTPPPFDHTKLMVVDDAWTLLGSANWDPRSLRLNFEFNVECYDLMLARQMRDLVERRINAARPVTLADVDGRSLPVRLRDGVARLFAPYL